jgi:hypothetical protein
VWEVEERYRKIRKSYRESLRRFRDTCGRFRSIYNEKSKKDIKLGRKLQGVPKRLEGIWGKYTKISDGRTRETQVKL